MKSLTQKCVRLAVPNPKIPDEVVVINNKTESGEEIPISKYLKCVSMLTGCQPQLLESCMQQSLAAPAARMRPSNGGICWCLCHPIVVSQAEGRESECLTFVPRTGWVGEGAGKEECGEHRGKQQDGKDKHRQWGRWGDESPTSTPSISRIRDLWRAAEPAFFSMKRARKDEIR